MSRQQDRLPRPWDSRWEALLESLPHGMRAALFGPAGSMLQGSFPFFASAQGRPLSGDGRKSPSGSRSSRPQASLANLDVPGHQGCTQWPVTNQLHSSQNAGLGASQSLSEFKVGIQPHYLNKYWMLPQNDPMPPPNTDARPLESSGGRRFLLPCPGLTLAEQYSLSSKSAAHVLPQRLHSTL